MKSFNEHLFTTNVFNKPLVIKDKEAVLCLIVRLILMDPGTISVAPKAGVGLVRKYRYLDSDSIATLENDVKKQIEMFLPYFTEVSVKISMDETKSLYIELDLDEDVFTLKSKIKENNEFSLERLL